MADQLTFGGQPGMVSDPWDGVDVTPGEGRLVDYVSSLVVTQGQGRGAPFQLLPWQRRFLKRAFAPGLSGDAALSVARGAGKSTLMAAVAAACVDGPLHEPRAEVVIVASSLDQARISFDHAAAFLLGRGARPRE